MSDEDTITALHATEYNSNKVLLMTALTTVTNPVTGKSWGCRVLLDSACDSTFIEDDLVKKLGLNMEPLPGSNVGGFGGKITKVKTQGVKFVIGGVEIKAKTTRSICRPLVQPIFTKEEMNKFQHLSGLDLADDYESNDAKHVDILIGADYFYTFIGDKVIRGAGGPVAVETSFGFTLSGGIPPLKIRSQPHLNLMMTCLKTAAVSNTLESK